MKVFIGLYFATENQGNILCKTWNPYNTMITAKSIILGSDTDNRRGPGGELDYFPISDGGGGGVNLKYIMFFNPLV